MTGQENRTRLHGLRSWSADLVSTSLGTASAAGAVLLTALTLWISRGSELLLPGAFWRSWWLQVPDLLVALVAAVVLGTVLVLLARLVRQRPPWLLTCSVVFGAILLLTTGAGASLLGWVAVVLTALAAAATAGSWLARRVSHGRARPSPSRWAARAVVTVLALLVAADLVWSGPTGSPRTPAATTAAGVNLADPTANGPFRVVESVYGSGAYTAGAGLGPGSSVATDPVDASTIIGGWDEGSTRSAVWGFTAADLPLNARVWAPAGAGPFPLVLVLHGNSAFAGSETGFAYLGTLLASRGYVVASVDENFLNTGLLDKASPVTGADAARAWLLLAHLHLWHTLDDTPGGPFAGRIDLDHVSLVGHSRGGEAVAVAASRADELGALAGTPPDPDVHVGTVVALAPSDGLYDATTPVELTGTSYLTLGGTHDADVSTFAGARQYARTATDTGVVKAAVSIGGANHTQFNSGWGRHDVGLGLAAHLLGTGALLSPEQQQSATKAFVSAFLDLTVRGRAAERPLFDGTATGMSWLPATTYVQQLASGPDDLVQQVRAGTDPTRSPLGTVTVTGGGVAPVALPTRTGPSTDDVLQLAWGSDPAAARYTVAGIAAGSLPAEPVLTAAIANGTTGAVDVQVTATDAVGRTATVPFGPHPRLAPLVTGSVLKPPVPGGSISEPVLQTLRLPLADVTGVDAASVTSIDITFTSSDPATVYLDDVGVTPARDR